MTTTEENLYRDLPANQPHEFVPNIEGGWRYSCKLCGRSRRARFPFVIDGQPVFHTNLEEKV